jgi:hypothetical protein
MSIEIANESGLEVDEAALSAVARHTLDQLGVSPLAELSVIVVDVAAMSALHERWMGEPGPTDVLAFPMDELDTARSPGNGARGTRARAGTRRRPVCSTTSYSVPRSPPTGPIGAAPVARRLELSARTASCTARVRPRWGGRARRHVRPAGQAARDLALGPDQSPGTGDQGAGRDRGGATMVWLIIAAAALALGAGLCASAEVALMRVSRSGAGNWPAAARATGTAPPSGSAESWPVSPVLPAAARPGRRRDRGHRAGRRRTAALTRHRLAMFSADLCYHGRRALYAGGIGRSSVGGTSAPWPWWRPIAVSRDQDPGPLHGCCWPGQRADRGPGIPGCVGTEEELRGLVTCWNSARSSSPGRGP